MSSTSPIGQITRGFAAAAVLTLVSLAPGAALADPYAGAPPPKVASVDRGAVLSTSQAVRSASSGSATKIETQSRGLPVTGGDLLPLTILGLGAVGAGSILVLNNRRRRAS